MDRETERGRARTVVVRRVLGVLVLGVLVAWGRGLVAAQTMEADHAAYWRRRRRSPGSLTLVALGDSLAQGMGSTDPSSSWAGRLAAAWEERSRRPETQRSGARPLVRVRVVCLGVVGATAADVLRDQIPDLPPADLVALGVGTNDAAQGVSPEEYRETFTELCAALPDGSLVADVPDLQRGSARRAGVELAAVAREVVAGFPGLRLVELEAATHRMWPWQFGPDLAHPNRLGYRRHARAWIAALD
ncbi:SGNH/GDSL hydrolase family protein [Actinomycetospora sp. OC33-EN08]|uniref:SGNH/GDSL hydrolase family protein n=1 Tax=Actinomycetospora aurantiaca TaxID=3129233 RepID=A0ABU8MR38_9PSEU